LGKKRWDGFKRKEVVRRSDIGNSFMKQQPAGLNA
jgi:hypothetical protein